MTRYGRPRRFVDNQAARSIAKSSKQPRSVSRRELRQRRKAALETIAALEAGGTKRRIESFNEDLDAAQSAYRECLLTMPRWWRKPRLWLDRRAVSRRIAALSVSVYGMR